MLGINVIDAIAQGLTSIAEAFAKDSEPIQESVKTLIVS
jgi:hypothetical protein